MARPNDTTPYTAGDFITSATPSPYVLPLFLAKVITSVKRVTLNTNKGTHTENLRLHLLSDITSSLPADNAPLVLADTDRLNYLGFFDFVTFSRVSISNFATSEGVISAGSFLSTVSGQVFGLLEAKAGFTPIALQEFDIQLYTTKLNENVLY